jgi:hypothetical protein
LSEWAQNCWGYSRGPCGGLPLVKCLKNIFLKIGVFKRETEGKRKNGWERDTKTGTGAGTRTGEGEGTGSGTRNVLDPSNAGYPPLVNYIFRSFRTTAAFATSNQNTFEACCCCRSCFPTIHRFRLSFFPKALIQLVPEKKRSFPLSPRPPPPRPSSGNARTHAAKKERNSPKKVQRL